MYFFLWEPQNVLVSTKRDNNMSINLGSVFESGSKIPDPSPDRGASNVKN
jgi:hypothetical protein